MKKFGTVLIAVLIGTILYEIIDPPIDPRWLRLIVELAVVVIFGFIGLGIFKSTGDTTDVSANTQN